MNNTIKIELSEQLAQALAELIPQIKALLPVPKPTPDFSALAYQWRDGALWPIEHVSCITLSDLRGIDRQKQHIQQNTEQFLKGFSANHVLLTGARGTGKSSLVRALLNDYAKQNLRLIEVTRDDLGDLALIKQQLTNRAEKFIIYCDDLAFNAEDDRYRALKSALDGSLQSEQDNVLIYATSNRRHLLPEFFSDNQLDSRQLADSPKAEIHPQEAVEEKISLSDRFGLWLTFYAMSQDTYLDIVDHWLKKSGFALDETTRAEALRWAHTRGQRSGRAAAQFAKHWSGLEQLKGQSSFS